MASSSTSSVLLHPPPRRFSEPTFMWGLKGDGDSSGAAFGNRTKGHAFRVLINPNAKDGYNCGKCTRNPERVLQVSSKKGSSKEVIMVDPLEAKRLAAKQMQQIKAKEKFKRKRQIEAINGAWAMIGLTAGLVIEGQTGKSILEQLSDYWGTVAHLFMR